MRPRKKVSFKENMVDDYYRYSTEEEDEEFKPDLKHGKGNSDEDIGPIDEGKALNHFWNFEFFNFFQNLSKDLFCFMRLSSFDDFSRRLNGHL